VVVPAVNDRFETAGEFGPPLSAEPALKDGELAGDELAERPGWDEGGSRSPFGRRAEGYALNAAGRAVEIFTPGA
jgi:hypothetical protein